MVSYVVLHLKDHNQQFCQVDGEEAHDHNHCSFELHELQVEEEHDKLAVGEAVVSKVCEILLAPPGDWHD